MISLTIQVKKQIQRSKSLIQGHIVSKWQSGFEPKFH